MKFHEYVDPFEIASLPYPFGYVLPKFILYNGKQGNAREHVVRFIETLGVYGVDKRLKLREFYKSLADHAYIWYTNLASGFITSWEDMVSKFYSKFFQVEERLTTLQLSKEVR